MCNRKENRKNRIRKRWMSRDAMVLIMVFFLVACVGLLAKYVTSSQEKAEMISAGFHFTSDYLKEKTENAEYTVYDWGNGISIQLNNYETDNMKSIAGMDIYYEVFADDGWEISVADANQIPVQAEGAGTEYAGSYLFPENAGNTCQKLTLQYTGKEQPSFVNVTVKSISPYEKTLTAKLNIVTKNRPEYSFKDVDAGHCLLTVRTNDYEGSFTVKWDETQFSPDNNNTLMTVWTDQEGTGSFETSANTEYELIFVKTSDENYNTLTGSGTSVDLKEVKR